MFASQIEERGLIRRTVWLTILVFVISALVWLVIFVLVRTSTAGAAGEAFSTPTALSSRLTQHVAGGGVILS